MKTKYTDYLLEITNPPTPSLKTPPLEVTNPEAMKEKPVKPAAKPAVKPVVKPVSKPVSKPVEKTPEKVAVTLDDAQYQNIIGSLKNFWTTLANAQTKAKPAETKPVEPTETKPVEPTETKPVARPKTNSDDLKNKLANEPKAQ